MFASRFLILFSFSMFLVSQVFGQFTAQDWTKDDCNGVNHHLFSELDSGKIIVIDYVMVPGCNGCIDATINNAIIQISFQPNYPNRVKLYSIGYDDTYTCTDMLDWKSSNLLHTTVFTGGGDDVIYYGGFGMPTVIILGGETHHVFYKKIGFVDSDTIDVRVAIQNALDGIIGIENPVEPNGLSVFPNPANQFIMIHLPLGNFQNASLELFNLAGEKVKCIKNINLSVKLSTEELPNGIYLLRLTDNIKGLSCVTKFIVRH